jgi:hypothetical protein
MNGQNDLERPLPVLNGEYRPVFVVGMNGSGTTMLLDSLGRHPKLYGFPQETRVIPHLIASVGQLGDLADDENFRRLWERVRQIPAFRLVNGGQAPPLPANWAEFPRSLAAVLDAMFRYFAAPHEKTRWCEKTPQHVQHLDSLHRIFPAAKFIHIIRDGRDCAASFQKRWKRTPELTVFRWQKVVSAGRAQGQRLGDCYFELKYEDLTLNPEHWMRRLCDVIGVPFHPNVLVSRRPQSDKRGILGGIEPNTEKWRAHFSAKRLERLERIAGAYLAELDYPVQYTQGSAQPSALRRRLWTVQDYLRQWRLMMGHKLRWGSRKPWSALLLLPIIAFKQSRANRY